jgi:endoglucanase
MNRLALILPLALLTLAPAARADTPPVVTTSSPIRIWVDQVGYRTKGEKMAVVASGSALPDDLQIELRDEKTDRPVWKLSDHPQALVKFNNGNKDKESGDFIDQLEFSGFATPGRYYLVLTAPETLRSYKFNIAENPYYLAGLAAWKGYYYNRADGEIPEKYGGAWNHGKAFLGPNQATEAQVYKWKGGRWPDQVGTEIIDPKKYDVHGGWWDAGDLNKYTSNTTNVQNMLLMAYEMTLAKGGGPLPKDSELNIPESGNGFPDALDEIRVATEFLIRDHDGTGAAFGRVHQEPGSPPETVTKPVQLTMPNSEVTMGRASALAYAAVVWRESKLDNAFATKCYEESLRSWNLLQQKPHPWPVDPKDPKKILSQGEMRGDGDYAAWRTIAAAALFRYSGNSAFDTVVRADLARRNMEKDANDPALWIYLHTKGADPALTASIKKGMLASADATLRDLNSRGYRMFVPGYWWGSNQTVGEYGGRLVLGALMTDDKDKKKAYLDGAENYVHYLYGRNPRGECYFSNMKSFGVERSAMVMFHSWVGNANSPSGKKYIGEGPGKIGPFPGYVIGGPNGGMTRLIEDPDLDWRKNPWEFNEPDIMYQSQCLRVLDAFIWPAP